MTKAIDFNGIFTPRHHYGAVLSILLIALLFGLAMLYQNPVSKTNAETNQVNTQTGSMANPAAESTAPAQPYKEMCGSFPGVQGEIPCASAIATALKQFPGKVSKIAKAQIGVRQRGSENSTIKDVWSVETVLDEPYNLPGGKSVNKMAVQVDRHSGDVLSLKMM